MNSSRVQGYTGRNSTIPVPSVLDNIHKYTEASPNLDPDALYVVSGGGNDAFFGAYDPSVAPGPLARATVADLFHGIHTLHAHGGRNFLMPSVPALQSTPYGRRFSNATIVAFLTEFSETFAHEVRRHAKARPTDARITLWKEVKAFARLLGKEGRKAGFKNSDEACLKGAYPGESPERILCSNADEHVCECLSHSGVLLRFLLTNLFRQSGTYTIQLRMHIAS